MNHWARALVFSSRSLRRGYLTLSNVLFPSISSDFVVFCILWAWPHLRRFFQEVWWVTIFLIEDSMGALQRHLTDTNLQLDTTFKVILNIMELMIVSKKCISLVAGSSVSYPACWQAGILPARHWMMLGCTTWWRVPGQSSTSRLVIRDPALSLLARLFMWQEVTFALIKLGEFLTSLTLTH